MPGSRAPKCCPRKRPRCRQLPTIRRAIGSAPISPQAHPQMQRRMRRRASQASPRGETKPRPANSCVVAGGAGDDARCLTPALRRAETLRWYRPMKRRQARMPPSSIREAATAARQARRRVRQDIQPAIARAGGGVGTVHRLVAWDPRCRRPIAMGRRRTPQVTALSRREPLTAKLAQARPRPTALVVRQVISACRCAAGVGFPARRACNAERRRWRRQTAIVPRARLRPARRVRKASSRPAGGGDAHPRVSAKLCRPAKTNQPTARGGIPLDRRTAGDPTAGPAGKDRATVNPSDLASSNIASEAVDRAMGTAAAHATATATTASRAAGVRAARGMGSAGGDAMPRQGVSSRSSIR
jgi:hypothetical protein